MVWVRSQREIEAYLVRQPGMRRAMSNVSEAVAETWRSLAVREAFDQGTYLASIEAKALNARSSSYVASAEAAHASALEGGTGLWGPRQAMIVAKPGKVMVFKTDIPYSRPGGPVATASHTGEFRLLRLRQHRGMEGRHLGQRAAILVALRSRRLTYRAQRWVQGR